ncbi:hypothetical protein ACJMK2_016648 [Sinanodonta woodiana]|uniref:Link domain-containing protein n=1 Tax=Sinanodonta woodiana TaxID=1069815 RepID=A0ABD3UXV2_SINWO
MNGITWFCALAAFVVASSEAIALKKRSLAIGLGTSLYPFSSSSFALSGRRFATASQKVTYYTTNYNMDFNSAKAFCESKGTYIATFEDLQAAYYDGYQKLSCGWTANGISYLVMQDATDDYASIGIIPCSMESNQGVFCRRPMPVFLSKNLRGEFNMTLAEARQHCHGKGSSLATFEDLVHAYHLGYEICSCGWADNGLTYAITHTPNHACMTSVGVTKCSLPMTWNAYCRSSEYGTEPYMHPSPVETSFALSGRRFATPSQKVTYYSTSYDMDFSAAKEYCESRRTYVATFEDLQAAYYDGYEKHSCGWTANGISYLVMQDSTNDYASIGVIPCSMESKRGVFCKRQTPVYISNDSRGEYKMTLAEARQHCHGKGTSLATFEDLAQAYSLGYETCSCGWTDNGFAYLVMQTPTQKCLTSVGVIKCNWQNTWNAFCKDAIMDITEHL